MASAAQMVEIAQQRVDEFLANLLDADLFSDLASAAGELYKEQFVKKENPYGEAWALRPGDDKRTKSYYKFGQPGDVERGSFSLTVAAPNAKRSCVPFEPRGLGAWRPRFEQIINGKARLRFTSVQP